MKELGQKPDWHSVKSWEIERLDWRSSPIEFDRLRDYARDCIEGELQARGHHLGEFLSDEQLNQVVLHGAKVYAPRHEVIGLASHITLWLRGSVVARMKRELTDDEIRSYGSQTDQSTERT
jgi:hypothetical protein